MSVQNTEFILILLFITYCIFSIQTPVSVLLSYPVCLKGLFWILNKDNINLKTTYLLYVYITYKHNFIDYN